MVQNRKTDVAFVVLIEETQWRFAQKAVERVAYKVDIGHVSILETKYRKRILDKDVFIYTWYAGMTVGLQKTCKSMSLEGEREHLSLITMDAGS